MFLLENDMYLPESNKSPFEMICFCLKKFVSLESDMCPLGNDISLFGHILDRPGRIEQTSAVAWHSLCWRMILLVRTGNVSLEKGYVSARK